MTFQVFDLVNVKLRESLKVMLQIYYLVRKTFTECISDLSTRTYFSSTPLNVYEKEIPITYITI